VPRARPAADPKYATSTNAAEGRISPTGTDLNAFIDQASDGMLATQGALPPLPAKVPKSVAFARQVIQDSSDDSDIDSADEEYAAMQTEEDGVVVATKPKSAERADEIDKLDYEQRIVYEGLPITEDPAEPHVVPAPINENNEPMVFSSACIWLSVQHANGEYDCPDGMVLQSSSIQKPFTRFTALKHVDNMQEPTGPVTEADVVADVVYKSKCQVLVPKGGMCSRFARSALRKGHHHHFSMTRYDTGAISNTTPDGMKVLVSEAEPESDDNETQVWTHSDTKPSNEMLKVAAEQVLGMVVDGFHAHGTNLTVLVHKGKNTTLADSIFGPAIEFVQSMASATRDVTVLAGVQLNDQCMPTEAMATETQPMAMALLWQMAVKCAPKGEALEHYNRLVELLEGESYPKVDSLPAALKLLTIDPKAFAEGCHTTFGIMAKNIKISPLVPDAFMVKINQYCNAMITATETKIEPIIEFFQEKFWDIVDGVGHYIKYKRCLDAIKMLEAEQNEMEQIVGKDNECVQEMRAIAAPPVVVNPKVVVIPKLAEWLDEALPELVEWITKFVVTHAPTENGKRDGLAEATTLLGDGSDCPKFFEFAERMATLFEEWLEKKIRRRLNADERELVIYGLKENQDGAIGGRRSRLVATIMQPLIEAEAAIERQAIEDQLRAAKLQAAETQNAYTNRRSGRARRAPKRLIEDDTDNEHAKCARVY
jgi:hypothetical protein